MNIFRWFFATCMVCMSMGLFAQEDPIHDVLKLSIPELMDIKVLTASKRAETVNNAPSIMTIISKDDLSQYASNNLGEVLNKMVSMQLLTANIFTKNVINTRGQSFTPYNNHLLFLINGRPIRDPISGGLNATLLNSFPISIIKRIEIIRGAESILYGSTAYSGVVNIITNEKSNKLISGNISYDYGSNDTRRTQFSTAISSNEINAQIGFNYYETDGCNYQFVDYSGLDSTANFWEKGNGLFAHINYKGLSFTSTTLEYKPYALGGINNSWSANWGDKQHDLSYFNDLSFLHDFNDAAALTTSITINRHVLHTDQGTSVEADDKMLESFFAYTPSSSLDFTFGGTFGVLSHNSDFFIDGNSRYGSLYFQGDYRISSKFKLTAGVQWNKVHGIKNNFSPRFGFVGNLSPEFGYKLLYGQAFRKGYPLETAFNIPQLLGNPNIEAELINTLEGNINLTKQRYYTSATLYYSHMHNLIERFPYNSTGSLRYDNGASQKFWGVEWEGLFSVSRNMKISANLSYQQNWNSEGVKNVSLHPNLMAKIGFNYNQDIFHLGVYNSFFSSPYPVSTVNPDVNTVNKEAEAYNLLSLKMSFDVVEHHGFKLNLYLQGKNMLNQDIRYPEYTSKGVNTLIPLNNNSHYSLGLNASF